MALWSKKEIGLLQDNLELSTKEVFLIYCDEYGSTRTYDSVQKKIKKLREALSELDEDEDQEVSLEEDLFQEEWSNDGDLFIPYTTPKIKKHSKDSVLDWLKSVLEAGGELEEQLARHPLHLVQSEKNSLVFLLSDVHVGKHTRYFNLDVANRRLLSIPEKIFATIGLAGASNVDEVVVVLLGDLIEGEDIYSTQAHHIECSAIEQVEVAVESLWGMLLGFRDIFKCTVRVETVPGNHGRTSKSANEKTNWDNVLHYMLHKMVMMHGDKKLVLNCNYNSFKTFKVKDRVVMAYHHGVKHTGTPAMREKIAGWSATKNFDVMVHGHWHEWHVGNWLSKVVIANGCLCGPDDLAERMAKEDHARQGFFIVTPNMPINSFSFIEWPTVR